MSASESNSIVNTSLHAAVIQTLTVSNHALQAEVAELRKEIDKLHHIIRSARFAPKSERLQSKEDTTAQPSLFGNIELPAAAKPQPIEAEIEVPAHKRRARKRYTDKDGNPSHFPEHLERRDTELSTEDSLVCCDCGADKHEVAQVVSEKLQVIPAQYFVERMIKKVLTCKHCEHKAPVKAASPDTVLPFSVLGKSFIVSFITNKFAWHLPFFRQSQMLSQVGIEIERDVLINTANKVSKELAPIVRYMAQQICKAELVHIDETPCVVGVREGKKTTFKNHSYFWPILADGMVVFHYTGNRKHSNVKEILGANFRGILMSDGYEAYQSYGANHPEVSIALCWDHARRKFFEISKLEPLAQEAVDRIGHLYRVEREIKERGLQGREISEYRKKHTLTHLNELLEWCKKTRDKACLLPKSKLLEAFNYVINHWGGLTVYLEHGIVPISNVIIEQQIRSLKLGAKNWLFAASEEGAEAVAIFNSLVCTCKINGINVFEYLNDVLGSLGSKSAAQLTPIAWAEEQRRRKLEECAR